MIAVALDAFTKHEVTDRVKLIEGPAAETLQSIRGEFDIIFIDADKTGYKNYLNIILERGLLSKNGIIITDNSIVPLSTHTQANLVQWLMLVLSRGTVAIGDPSKNPYSTPGRLQSSTQAMKEFNAYVVQHPKLETVVLPLFDGIGLIRLKD